MKKISKNLLAFLLMVLLLAATAVGVAPVQADTSFTYDVADGAVTITGCDADVEGVLEIPAKIEDVPVTAIAQRAFYANKKITEVTIPASVTAIGEVAFGDCTSLTAIRVNKDNTAYCDENGVLFSKDKKTLIFFPPRHTNGGYTIPDSVTTIGARAFFGCLLSAVEIPHTVTSIESSAFHFSPGLTQVTLPDSITAIEYGVFSSCINLMSVTIPDSVTSIGNYAFAGCTQLEAVTIPASVTSIGDSAFSGCYNLKKINIPAGVTAINNRTFFQCKSLPAIQLPDSVTSIGNRAFFFCDELKTVGMSEAVTSIGNEAFAGCYSLSNILLPESLAVIGEQAFHYCLDLDAVVIPNGVTAIGYGAFAECSTLAEVTVSDRVSALSASAFRNCSKLTTVTLPRGMVSIGYDAFFGCDSLARVQYGGSIDDREKIVVDAGNNKLTTVEWIYAIQEDDAPVVQPPAEVVDEGLPSWLVPIIYIVVILLAIGFIFMLFRKPSEY